MFGVDEIFEDLKEHLDGGLKAIVDTMSKTNEKLDRIIQLLEEKQNGQTKLGSDVHDDVLPSSESE